MRIGSALRRGKNLLDITSSREGGGIDWLKVQGVSAYTALFAPTIAGFSCMVFATPVAAIPPLAVAVGALLLSYFAQDIQDSQWRAGEAARDAAWCAFMRKCEEMDRR